MRLRPIEPAECDLVAGWLGEERNYRWLHFGPGTQVLTAVALRVMLERDLHCLRLYTAADGAPVGLAALSDIDREFGTATLWYVLGDKRYAGRGYTTRAVSGLLRHGFRELGLASVQAWTVETNRAGQRILQRNGFRFIGRFRRCHRIDDQPLDRLLYDLLAREHRERLAARAQAGHPSNTTTAEVTSRS